MSEQQKIDYFYQFLRDNKYIIVRDNYDCCILSEFITSIKKLFENYIYSLAQSIGYKEISTPTFIHEDLYLGGKSDSVKYCDYKTPALIYQGGRRLKKAYVLSPSIDIFAKILFEQSVHSYRDLPLRIVSRAFGFNSKNISCSLIKSFEYKTIELICYVESENIIKEIETISNAITQLFSAFKIEVSKTIVNKEVIFYTKVGEENIVLCKYGQTTSAFDHQLELSYTGKCGNTKQPCCINCKIMDSLFWYFLFSHFDGIGFRLPTMFLRYEVVIIPINSHKKDVLDNYISSIEESLKINNIRFFTDYSSSESLGEKHYKWEKIGVPLRIEIGNKECEELNITVINRYTKERKVFNSSTEIATELNKALKYWE